MSNTRRIPFVLNLDDPVDAAIWEALEPLLTRRRASQFIRGAVAHALGVGGLLPPVVAVAVPDDGRVLQLPEGPLPRAKRPTRRATVEDEPLDDPPDDNALDEATNNFLSAFG